MVVLRELIRICCWTVLVFWWNAPRIPVYGSAYFDCLGEVIRNLAAFSGDMLIYFWTSGVISV